MKQVVTSESHNEKLLNAIVNRMVEKHDCHTILLYGSRATEQFEPSSDFDICGFRDAGEAICDCEVLPEENTSGTRTALRSDHDSSASEVLITDSTPGALLDAWIYPASLAVTPDQSLMRLRNARILLQKEDLAERCLDRIEKLFARGPSPLPDWEKQKRLIWMNKTLARVRKDDLEGRYRAHWLLHLALEYYFEMRQKWYLGSKASFKWLAENDREFLQKFENALANPLDHEALARLIEGVAP